MNSLIASVMAVQAITGLPSMLPGTDVRVVLPDLVTVLAAGKVENGKLVLGTVLEPGREVRLLISYRPTGELVVPVAYVSPRGNDILVQFGGDGPISLRKWLREERGIELVIFLPGS